MPELGAPELLIILVVVVLVFGGSRVAELGGSLGKGIKEFKKEMRDDAPVSTETAVASVPAPASSPVSPTLTQPKRTLTCPSCKTENAANAVFCNECGARLSGVHTEMAPQS